MKENGHTFLKVKAENINSSFISFADTNGLKSWSLYEFF